MDLLVTFIGVYGMGFQEGNQFIVALLPYPLLLIILKVGMTAFVAWWWHTYYDIHWALNVFQWGVVALYMLVIIQWLVVICTVGIFI